MTIETIITKPVELNGCFSIKLKYPPDADGGIKVESVGVYALDSIAERIAFFQSQLDLWNGIKIACEEFDEGA